MGNYIFCQKVLNEAASSCDRVNTLDIAETSHQVRGHIKSQTFLLVNKKNYVTLINSNSYVVLVTV